MVRKQVILLAFLALGADRLAAEAIPADNLPEKFGALQTVDQISLSPHGTKIAFLGHLGANQVIYVVDLVAGGAPKPIIKAESREARFSWCGWSTPQRLVCDVRTVLRNNGVLFGFSRLIALDADRSRLVKLTPDQSNRALRLVQYGGSVLDWSVRGEPGKILISRQYAPENSFGSKVRREKDGFGVEMLDTVTLKRVNVESPRQGAVDYMSDGGGNVRMIGIQGTDKMDIPKTPFPTCIAGRAPAIGSR